MSAQRLTATFLRRVPLQARSIIARPASRTFSSSVIRRKTEGLDPKPGEKGTMIPFEEVKSEHDLLGPGAKPGTVPTDLEQATGLERLEILGKMQGVDIFDMKPLPSDRKGTFEDPIVVKSAGDELQCGCTGSPADSHHVRWVVVSRKRPFERCDECGSIYKMEYIGVPEDPHDHHHHSYEEPKTMADFVKPDYWYR
ncbi:putative cytochrome c subunit vb [Phaeomoniella chlamydospora]|uniref:Cytochrome c oxidase subunit 4, mitochondrial n=1 Tax=Phaeomoniella chlamydospora TaxID=158046 RepID=A0A0G2G2G0_PHACM|nr:putative cytochrome c subunit vb [Phaeomoniella chlamydospora]